MSASVSLPSDSRILIVLLGALGDIARGSFLPQLLRQKYSDAHITWLVEPKWRSFVELIPSVNDIVVFERHNGLRAVGALHRELSRRNFDLTLDLQRHFKSGLFSWFSGAKYRIGFHRSNAKECNWLFQTAQTEPYTAGSSKVDHYVAFAQALGITPPAELPFSFPRDDLAAKSEALLSSISPQCVGVVMGSSWESKDWVLSGYKRLCDGLLQHEGRSVVLLGDSSQTDDARKIVEACGERALVDLTGRTSVPELTAVLARCDVAVGPDSGPGHIASAVGTPYVSLFGPTDERRVAPYRADHLVVRADVGCAPCLRRKCPGLDRLCMRMIRVNEVMSRIESVLSMAGGEMS